MFVFHHITRTGGGTINYILRRNFGDKLLMIHGKEISKVLGYERNHPTGGSDALTKSLDDDELQIILNQNKGIHCISSHSFKFPNKFSNFNVMVFIRNPIDQILSLYYTLCKRFSGGRELPDYANCDFRNNFNSFKNYSDYISNNYGIKNYCKNFQTHNIDNFLNIDNAIKRLKEEFWFVGITERFDESILILKNKFKQRGIDFDINYLNRNVNNNRIYKRSFVNSILNDYHENIINLNSMDIKLYDCANKILDKQILNYEGDFYYDLNTIRKKLKFWTFYQNYYPVKLKNVTSKFFNLFKYKNSSQIN